MTVQVAKKRSESSFCWEQDGLRGEGYIGKEKFADGLAEDMYFYAGHVEAGGHFELPVWQKDKYQSSKSDGNYNYFSEFEGFAMGGDAKASLGTIGGDVYSNRYVDVDGRMDVLTAEVNADITFGTNKQGRADIYVGAGAVAAVYTAETDITFEIAGFEISINLEGFLAGVGAGANAGIKDGELTLGFKISSGVGGGVQLGIRKK